MQRQNKKNFLSFGDRLRDTRKNSGLSQSTLTNLLGFSAHGVVSRFERGERTPDLETLAKIAEICHVDLHWLITGKPGPIAQEAAKERQDAIEKLARYVSSEVAELLGRRESLLARLEQAGTDQVDGKTVDLEYVAYLNSQIEPLQEKLIKALRDQEWVSLALAESTNSNPG